MKVLRREVGPGHLPPKAAKDLVPRRNAVPGWNIFVLREEIFDQCFKCHREGHTAGGHCH